MKYILLSLFMASSVYSQTDAERNFIISQSDKNKGIALNDELERKAIQNKKDIEDFIQKNPSFKDKDKIQRIIGGFPIMYQEDNNVLSVETLRAHHMYPGGSLNLNVTGQGITIGVWDGGKVRDTHVEFQNRITLGDNSSSLSSHGTHVTGTVLAGGVSPLRRGFAYQATGRTYDWNNDATEVSSFAGSGFLVSNHSYGNIATSLPMSTFGAYNGQSIEVDQIMNQYTFYQMVKSAGNDRNNTAISQVVQNGGYDLLSGVSTAKNVITVAAVEGILEDGTDNTFVMSSFSNYGPTDDGRIKPDISAKGVAVSSPISNSNNSYGELQGTSMAAPAITGLIALLQKHYNNVTGSFMKSATVRALLFQTARESGDNVGPDYSFGWGVADGGKAAQVITNKDVSSIIEENILNNGQTYTKNITINSTQDINVMIAWTDPTGVANSSSTTNDRTPRLVHNLDLKVLKDGTTYYPWKLNPDGIFDPPTNNSDNDVDNSERVEIFNAQPGTYTIQVTHKGVLQNGTQEYSLVATSTTGLSLNSPDFIADNNFFVYPIPAKDVISFTNPNNFDVKDVSITDISGKLVVSNPVISSNSIDISNLQTGVYFIKFSTDSFSTVKKFVKN